MFIQKPVVNLLYDESKVNEIFEDFNRTLDQLCGIDSNDSDSVKLYPPKKEVSSVLPSN